MVHAELDAWPRFMSSWCGVLDDVGVYLILGGGAIFLKGWTEAAVAALRELDLSRLPPGSVWQWDAAAMR